MREAVIVSTARTPIGKAYRGALNNTSGPTMAAMAIKGAIAKADLDSLEIEDLILGCALTQGSTGSNVTRHTVVAAALFEVFLKLSLPVHDHLTIYRDYT